MTLEQWTSEVTEEFQEAGFTVTEHLGFPLVAKPADLKETVRLIKFHGRWAVQKNMYADGMVLTPVGIPGNPKRT